MTDKQDAPQGFEVKTVPGGYVPAAVPAHNPIADGTAKNAGITNRPGEGPQQDASTRATSGAPAEESTSPEKSGTAKGRASAKGSGETTDK